MSEYTSPTIRPLHTACVDCIFSEKDKQKQTGCSFDKIDLYKKKGVDVIEAYDEFNNEFFVINDRVCLHKRTKLWAEDYPKKKWKPTVEEQVKIKYHAMVIFREEASQDWAADLKSSLMSLNDQEVPPCLLTIINRSKIAATSLVEYIHSIPCDNLDWRLQTFLDDELDDRGAIDIVVDSTKNYTTSIFYVVFDSSFEVPSKFSSEIQSYFVENANHAVFAHPRKDGNGMLVNCSFHKKHAGNCFNVKIEDKLIEFEEEEIKEYIKNIEEICPSLKM